MTGGPHRRPQAPRPGGRAVSCDPATVVKTIQMEGRLQTEAYGQELILDLHGCNASRYTRKAIEQYFVEVCELIDMERCDLHFWDDVGVPEDEWQADPKTKGTSAVQFILTSTVVIHTLELTKAAYVNIFSCKDFDTDEAASFTANWFGSNDWTANVVIRR